MTETPGANPERPPVMATEVHEEEEPPKPTEKEVVEQDVVVKDLENLAEIKP